MVFSYVQHAPSVGRDIFVGPLDGSKGRLFFAEVELEKSAEEQALFMYSGPATKQDVDVVEEKDEWTCAMETIFE